MVIFKYEMRQLRKSIILWSLILSSTILLMLPVYVEMVTSSNIVSSQSFSDNSFFNSIGATMETLATPLGIYSFLTFFIMFACAIHGMNMGLNIMTKEYKQNSADFLMTKPWSRGNIYMSKLLASATGTIIIGAFYVAASWGAMLRATEKNFNVLTLTLIAVSIIFVQLMFLSFGMLIGVIFPKIRTTLSIASGVVFLTYVTGSMSRIAGIDFLGYFSPLHYFNGAKIILIGGYEVKYVLLSLILLLVFVIAGHHIFYKKDVMLVS